MTKNEVMQIAIDALENAYDAINAWGGYASTYFQEKHDLEADVSECRKSIEVLRAALAQPEPEPVAWIFPDDLERFENCETFATAYSIECISHAGNTIPLYTAPPQQAKQEPVSLPDFPERESLADLPYAQEVPDDWIPELTHAWQRWQVAERNNMILRKHIQELRALYTAPPQRNPLSDEQIVRIADFRCGGTKTYEEWVQSFARSIEAAHGITGDA